MAKGNTVINLSKDDFKRKSFKTAPGGTYFIKIGAKSALKEMNGGTGLNLTATITKGPHKGVNFFDNIGPNVKWKIAQLVSALGITKTKFTMSDLLKLVKGGELRAILREKTWEGKKRNEVVQYLPLTISKDEPTAGTDDDDDEEDETEEEILDDADDEDDEDLDDEEDDTDSEDEEDDDLEDDDEEDEDEDEDDDSDEDEDDEEESDDEDEDEDEEDSDEEDEEEEDDSDDEEEDDEEEEPAPRRRAPAKKAPAKKAPAKKAPAKKSSRRK